LGEALKTGVPGSAHSTIMAFSARAFWRGWEEIIYSLETGKPAFEKVWGMPIFDYLATDPEAASYFSGAMVGFHGSEPPTVAAAYDFSRIQTVVDVGGATGNMLAALLSHHTHLRGILFDLPHVVADAPALLKANGVEDRVVIETGSFFDRVPAGGDAYLLSHVIHDWSEEQCLAILSNCRRAMNPGGRVLIIETVLADGDTPHPGKIFDILMLGTGRARADGTGIQHATRQGGSTPHKSGA
jgi:SAM-dependent methyltransferase